MKRNSAENKVRKVLRDNGFTLSKQKDQTHQGVDIVAMKKGQVLLIEVKKASLHNRAWQVDSVSKKQGVVCNTIAIVTPHGVVFQPMKEHLKLCAANGMRYITDLVGLLKLL
jgi:Holliday junction resolvase-like predicted endonuclease